MASPDSRNRVEGVADYVAASMLSLSLIKLPMRGRSVPGNSTAEGRAGVMDHDKIR